MGDPRKLRKKYDTPRHPWKKSAIELERKIKSEYGLVNKKEIWKVESFLKRMKNEAKRLTATKSVQAEKERKLILTRLFNLGLLSTDASLDDVLGLTIYDVLERRLQSILVRRTLSRSMKQARQFITHRHILVGKNMITFPSYLVSRSDESLVSFAGSSALKNKDHPERKMPELKKEVNDKSEAEIVQRNVGAVAEVKLEQSRDVVGEKSGKA